MKDAPIGIIDSGLGGLSVLEAIRLKLPYESTIYLADHAFFPYGTKETTVLNQRLVKVVNFLLGKRIKALVVACNTATVNTIKFLRKIYSLPIVGTEPAVKSALKEHHQEKIVVLTTPSTAQKSFYGSSQAQIKACPGLAEGIENYAVNPAKLALLIKAAITDIKVPYTALVLGCTHYLLVKDLFSQFAPAGVEVFDPSKAIARRTRQLLEEENLLSGQLKPGQLFFTTGKAKQVSVKAAALLKKDIIFSPCSL
ncbi:MAG TPA: glutamate racemase [Patescibacteria group bacterium]|nr:glutamate racemase [Patescibacteria group bacterium]